MLNEKQESFIQHYVLTRNATESAKAAGYSSKSAYNQGYRLLQDEEIQQRIYDAEQEMTTDVNVISELENQYSYAKGHGHTNSAIKALELLSRVRGSKGDSEKELNKKELKEEIIKFMEIIGKEEVEEIYKKCAFD